MTVTTVFEYGPGIENTTSTQYWECTIPNGETSPPVISVRREMTVKLIAAGGATGKVQYTLSLPSKVADNSAHWSDWALGTVSVASADVPEGRVTAVRGVSVSGTVILEVME